MKYVLLLALSLISCLGFGQAMEVTATIATLLNNTPVANGKTVYVKGYYTGGDGGGGIFVYDSQSTLQTNHGIVFTSQMNSKGRWIRQYEGYMNVLYFGVQRDFGSPYPGFSNSERIQEMIDYAAEHVFGSHVSDVTIFFPNGQYHIDKPLTLKNKIKLLGSVGTLLTNRAEKYDYMFEMDKGPVTQLRMENFVLNPNNQPGVGGIHLKAAFGEERANAGGIWDANFKNIKIINLAGHGIYLEGGEAETATAESSDWLLPNQFIVFENVRVTKEADGYYALMMTGQNANYTFLNCDFSVEQDIKPDGACVYISSVNAGTEYPKMESNATSFINCVFGGYTRYACIIQYAALITFDASYFEAVDTAFDILDSEQITITNNHFANAAGSGSLPEGVSRTSNKGAVIAVENSIVNIENNRSIASVHDYPALQDQYFVEGRGNNNVINLSNNTFSTPALGKTKGIMQYVSVEDNTLNTGAKKLVYVTADANVQTDITRIDSEISVGENIFIRADGGTLRLQQMQVQNGGNISLNGRSSLKLANGQAALFLKIESPKEGDGYVYQLVSVE